MKVNMVSLHPDRASPAVFLGHLKNQQRLEHDELEQRRQNSSSVPVVEDAPGTLDKRGELAEIDACLMEPSEGQTKQHLRHAHKQPRFQIKTFLSKAGTGRTIVYAPGKQILFEQGKRGNAVFYVLAGMVKLTVVAQGKETTIGLLGPGNFVGKECIATFRPRRTASATALTNCTIVRIERKEMLRVIQHEKTFAAFFLDYLLARISEYQEVIVDQLVNPSEKRLARALLILANFGHGGKPEEVVPQIHQEELAEMVGTTRSRISFFMNRFRKLGFIAYKGQSCITIRTAKLARFVTT
jgi:CRP/FNR family cyclic AMP-dependent transcriptional regulator